MFSLLLFLCVLESFFNGKTAKELIQHFCIAGIQRFFCPWCSRTCRSLCSHRSCGFSSSDRNSTEPINCRTTSGIPIKLRCRYRCRYSYEVFHCKVYKREVNRNPIDKQLPISIVHFYWTRSINCCSSYRLRRICLIDGINSGICYGYIGCCPCTIPKLTVNPMSRKQIGSLLSSWNSLFSSPTTIMSFTSMPL